CQQYTDSPYSF
nr:immunoglobulin light chain junction region [Macaca mulatta]MOW62113.1 immunoglobulin light chain junction region [Macaca mulatta]MOW65500.1 immunoglobulin light chain junction region [Macaca mulatta]